MEENDALNMMMENTPTYDQHQITCEIHQKFFNFSKTYFEKKKVKKLFRRLRKGKLF